MTPDPLIPKNRTPHPSLPLAVRQRLAGRSFAMTLPRPVKLRLRRPERIGVAEWAAKYRVVTDGAHSGPWRHEYAPHTVAIMEAFGRPWTREVWFCGVEQSGKTNTMLNCLGWVIDCDPGSVFYLMPTEDTAAKVTGGKIRPMIERSPRLARYLSARTDDTTLARTNLSHGMTIIPAWANSPAAMATWAAKYCFGDEVDKYPPMAGKEADPITLIRKRNRTYKGRYKRFFSSTPAGLFIHRGTYACEQVWQYRSRCPECRELVRMTAEHLTVAHGRVGYACDHCGVVWDEASREMAIRSGAWECVKGQGLTQPATVGFHHRAWDCLDITLTEIGEAWEKSQGDEHSAKVAWANGYEAIDYVPEHRERQEDVILRLVDQAMPRGVVPRDPAGLVLLVDTQARGFFYQVWAFGWGRDLESWRIDHGFVERFANLKDLGQREYHDPDGVAYRPTAAFIDSGGGTDPQHPRHSRTAEVYEFCRRNPLFRPLKGRQRQAQPWAISQRDFYPTRSGKKIAIPGGLTLYTIDVTYYKDTLAAKLLVEPGDPGAWHLHAEVGDDFAKQLCAEYRDERGVWHCPRGRANHHWDIAVYGMASADILGIRNWQRPENDTRPARPERQHKPTRW